MRYQQELDKRDASILIPKPKRTTRVNQPPVSPTLKQPTRRPLIRMTPRTPITPKVGIEPPNVERTIESFTTTELTSKYPSGTTESNTIERQVEIVQPLGQPPIGEEIIRERKTSKRPNEAAPTETSYHEQVIGLSTEEAEQMLEKSVMGTVSQLNEGVEPEIALQGIEDIETQPVRKRLRREQPTTTTTITTTPKFKGTWSMQDILPSEGGTDPFQEQVNLLGNDPKINNPSFRIMDVEPFSTVDPSPSEESENNSSIMGEFIEPIIVEKPTTISDLLFLIFKLSQQIEDFRWNGAPQPVTESLVGRKRYLSQLASEFGDVDTIPTYYWYDIVSGVVGKLDYPHGPFSSRKDAERDIEQFLLHLENRREGIPRIYYSEAVNGYVEQALNRGCCQPDNVDIQVIPIRLQLPSVDMNLNRFMQSQHINPQVGPSAEEQLIFAIQDGAVTRDFILVIQPWTYSVIQSQFKGLLTSFINGVVPSQRFTNDRELATEFIHHTSPLLILGWNRQIGKLLLAPEGYRLPLYSENIYCGTVDSQCYGVTVALYDVSITSSLEGFAQGLKYLLLSHINNPSLDSIQPFVQDLIRAISPASHVDLSSQLHGMVSVLIHIGEDQNILDVIQLAYEIYGLLLENGFYPSQESSKIIKTNGDIIDIPVPTMFNNLK